MGERAGESGDRERDRQRESESVRVKRKRQSERESERDTLSLHDALPILTASQNMFG